MRVMRHRHKGTGINADFKHATTKARPSSLQDPRDEKDHGSAQRFLDIYLKHVVNPLWGHLKRRIPHSQTV
jgi:hypothetical protein